MISNTEPRQITVAEMAPHVHSFGINENKVNKISVWLIKWIKNSLKAGKIKPYDLLPTKGDLAFHIGVSKGTIQNVFRYVEDCGLVASKQRIGTFIKGNTTQTEKLTSKRELAVEKIKKYILENKYQAGDLMISTRKLAEITGISNATIRMAMGSLVSEGIIVKKNNSFLIANANFDIKDIQPQTLVEKVAHNLKEYIRSNYKIGEKLPTNPKLAKIFNVSVKTIHDAVKHLSKEGLLRSRRGQYGTIIVNSETKEKLYFYEKVELKIRHYIMEHCQINDKLPSIVEFSKAFQISPKTVKKALDNLAEDGFITFARGRYGGTFVTDIPQESSEAYKWLALSSDYVSNT